MLKAKSIADALTKSSTFIPAVVSVGFSSRYDLRTGKYKINNNYRKFEAVATGLNSGINLAQAARMLKERDLSRACVAALVGAGNGIATYGNLFNIRHARAEISAKVAPIDLAIIHGALGLSSVGSAYATSNL